MFSRFSRQSGILFLVLTLVCLCACAQADNSRIWASDEGLEEVSCPVQFLLREDTAGKGTGIHPEIPAASAVLPMTAFSFSVVPGREVAANEVHPAIHAGPADGITLKDTPTDTWSETFTGKALDSITIQVHIGAFHESGIYRYLLTQEPLTDAQKARGISSAGRGTRVLDIYARRVHGVLRITSMVLSDAEEPDVRPVYDPEAPGDAIPETTGIKSDGFLNLLDVHDVTITKIVQGSGGSEIESFPFTVRIDDDDLPQDGVTRLRGYPVKVIASNGAGEVTDVIHVGETMTGILLRAGESITLKNVPDGLTVRVMETVDVSEGYLVTSEVSGTDVCGTIQAEDEVHGEHGQEFHTYGRIQGGDVSVSYINTRDTISPTGIYPRVLPAVFLIITSCMLLVTAGKRIRG